MLKKLDDEADLEVARARSAGASQEFGDVVLGYIKPEVF